MVTYVQIGKKPRMAINDTIPNIRNDFIKQIPSWKELVPIYFYSNAKGSDYKGVLVPYRVTFSNKERMCKFFWVSENEYWYAHVNWKTKVDRRTFGWDELMDILNMYREKGFVF